MAAIRQFKARWHCERKLGQIEIVSIRSQQKTLVFTDAAEFVAVLNLLNSTRSVEERDGWIETGTEKLDHHIEDMLRAREYNEDDS